MKQQSELVSVVIPFYNVELYAEEAVQSIIGQTYKNLEIILVDDGSTDNTHKILTALAEKDKRIKLCKIERNIGVSEATNRGLSLATGEYIAKMDGDDISALDRIEKQVRFLEQNSDYDLVGCSVITIDINGNHIGKITHYSNQKILLSTLPNVSPVSHPAWTARKSVYDKLKYRKIPCEDYDFLLRMTSIKLKYTNLEDYYGCFYRIGRSGSSADVSGYITRLKEHDYVYSLFLEREKYGKDSFSAENARLAITPYELTEKLHQLAVKCVEQAIIYEQKGLYFRKVAFLLLSCISPYQIRQFYRAISRKRIINNIRKHPI